MTAPTGWPALWQALPRYLPWHARTRPNGMTGKVPHGVVEGHLRPVDPLCSSYWLGWEDAWTLVTTGQADGVGLAVTPDLGVVIIDLDACVRLDGTLSETAQEVLRTFPDAYVEVSPSGCGLHVVLSGSCSGGWRRQPGVEILDRGFVTVTGRSWRAPTGLPADASDRLRTWHAALAQSSPAPPPPRSTRPTPDNAELLHRAQTARNGARFQALWDGELAGCETPSEADFQLVLLLLYWGGAALSDDRLSGLLRQSGRHRPKWGTTETLSPYALRTMAAARTIAARRH